MSRQDPGLGAWQLHVAARGEQQHPLLSMRELRAWSASLELD